MRKGKNITKDINTHGLVRILGKSIKIQSAGAEPKRKECSFSTQSISQEKVLPWRLTALRVTVLSGFSTQMFLRFSQRAGFHEGEKGPIYRCMPTILILTFSFFLVVFFLFFPTRFFPISFLSFLSLSQSFRCSSFLFTARPSFYSACRDPDFTILALNSLCLVWMYWSTITVPSVCRPPITRQGRVFCLLVCRGIFSCYGLDYFSLPIPHGMHLMVPTQLASFG